jgi:benzoyl-CoA reductase/2-hydroxyglutaryl-CoA dehydratase subunit BcrC/BadD/HgdB
MAKIGLTTTIPQEVIWAAGHIPVDLNNLFVSSKSRERFLVRARHDGYPRTVCPWIAGIYGAVVEERGIDAVVIVTQGDCSNTHALAETLEDVGVKIIPFGYPYDGDSGLLRAEIERLARYFGVHWDEILRVYDELKRPRELARKIDEATWQSNTVSGFENHLQLVSTSDFNSDVSVWMQDANELLKLALPRTPFNEDIRLGYIGVPPIFPNIYEESEKIGARVVFNETQRQFSLPFTKDDFLTAYSKYTYPKSVFKRIEDISNEIRARKIDGIIHYTQSFCFRQIEDLLFRKHLDVPILTIEGECDFQIDERTRIRLEAFIEMLRGLK